MQLSLADRTYLITGGGSGIGKGAAAAIVAAGGNVMIIGRNADKLAAAADEIATAGGPGAVQWQPADVTKEDEVSQAVDAATVWHGRLDGVVHSAGGTETIGPITQIDSELWRRAIDLNVNGSMYVIKHAAREIVRCGGGSIVAVSSIAAAVTHRWFGAYGVAKYALDYLVKLAADELGPSLVRVNSVRPSLTKTDMVAPVLESPELSGDYRINTPIPRPGEVEDVANLVLFLLSDEAAYITGQTISVDGGHHLRRGPDISPLITPLFGEDGLRGVVG